MPSIIKNGVNYTNSELLSTLSDTNISSPANGEALVYDSVNQKWINGEAGGKVWQGTQAQYDAITNPDPDTTYFITDGQQVTSNMWEGTAAEYAQITDPDPGTFYFIKDGESVSCNLGELNDVSVSGATTGQVLTKGVSSWEASTMKTSDLNNDSGFITASGTLTNVTSSNIDTMRTPGLYYGSFTNSPVPASEFGFLIVAPLPNSSYVYQQFVGQRWNGEFSIMGRISQNSSTWYSWKTIFASS